MKIVLASSLFFFVLFSCNNTPTKTSNDKKLNKDSLVTLIDGKSEFSISFPENRYLVSVSKEQVLITKKNSKITVPKNAFEFFDGKKVTGEVEIKFSEYHTQGEIIASKIPMVYKSEEGEFQDFESAGMFEIRAYQKGEELKLTKEKKIKVDLMTSNNGAFNFYNLDENRLNWNLIDSKCLPIENKEIATIKAELDSIAKKELKKPKKPVEMKGDDKVFDINLDYDKYPNLRDLNGVMWKNTEKDLEKKELVNSKFFKKSYKFLRLEPLENEELEYKMVFVDGKDSITFTASPVFKGKLLSLQKEKNKALIEAINISVKRENRLQDQLKRENELLRTFNVDQMGIYNYDRQFKDRKAISILANFTFEGSNSLLEMDEVSVYLIPSSKNVVIKYTKETFQLFAINPNENNKLIAILPNNEVFYLSNNDIHKLNILNFKDQKLDIQLKKYKKDVKEAKQLDELIASI